jgi:hypothetical protein
MADHATVERRSLRYHRVIAARIAADPSIVQRALARVDGWLRSGDVATYYAQGWRAILSQRPEEIGTFLCDASEHARAFRQVSPFAGALSPEERWQLWAAEDDDDASAA